MDTFDPLGDSDQVPLTGRIQPDHAGGPSSSARTAGGPSSSTTRPINNRNSNNSNNNNAGGFAGGLTQSFLTSNIPGEDRRATSNTIDESVWETLNRDLRSVWSKMRQVLWPKYLLGGILSRAGDAGTGTGAEERGEAGSLTDDNPDGTGNGNSGSRLPNINLRNLVGRWPDAKTVLQPSIHNDLRDWDLWGPLLFCLLLAFLLSRAAQDSQKSLVFSGVFAIVWVGEAVVTLQIKLLGGHVSFFQAISIIGYTLFPLVIAAILSALNMPFVVRLPVDIVMVVWALAAGVSILGGSGVVANRVGLAVYPLFIFYLSLGCLCLVT